MSEEEDFEDQLKQEKIAKAEAEDAESAHRGKQYTDTDGAVMEWDPAKKAYFPKIDSDFIARYQMNYGVDPSAQPEGQATAPTGTSDSGSQPSAASTNQAWNDYYDYYNQGGAPAPESDKQNYTTQDYYNYYAYYYGEDYAKKWLNTVEEHMEEEEERKKEEEERRKEEEGTQEEQEKKEEEEERGGKGKKKKGKDKDPVKRKAPEEPPAWFEIDNEKSTHVYVSNLPSDLTDEDFKELMAKCGLIMFDPLNHKPKLKLYRKPDGTLKGDGLCCYIKQESVDLALNILDGSNVNGNIISVERAKFELKGDFDPTKKKKKLSNKAKRKMKEKQAKLFDWRPDTAPGTRFRFERIVILKNMFDPVEFEEEPTLINELREDVRTECSKFGDVRKVVVHDHHKEGVISITFRSPEEGDACVAAMKGRWFAKRQIDAQTYDGKTKYQVTETDAEREERLKGWEEFLLEREAGKDSSEKVTEKMGNQEGQSSSMPTSKPKEVTVAGPFTALGSVAAAGAASSVEVSETEQASDLNRTEQPPSIIASSEDSGGAAN